MYSDDRDTNSKPTIIRIVVGGPKKNEAAYFLGNGHFPSSYVHTMGTTLYKKTIQIGSRKVICHITAPENLHDVYGYRGSNAAVFAADLQNKDSIDEFTTPSLDKMTHNDASRLIDKSDQFILGVNNSKEKDNIESHEKFNRVSQNLLKKEALFATSRSTKSSEDILQTIAKQALAAKYNKQKATHPPKRDERKPQKKWQEKFREWDANKSSDSVEKSPTSTAASILIETNTPEPSKLSRCLTNLNDNIKEKDSIFSLKDGRVVGKVKGLDISFSVNQNNQLQASTSEIHSKSEMETLINTAIVGCGGENTVKTLTFKPNPNHSPEKQNEHAEWFEDVCSKKGISYNVENKPQMKIQTSTECDQEENRENLEAPTGGKTPN